MIDGYGVHVVQGALSRAWDGRAVEAEFKGTQMAVLDQAMSGAALRGLLELCRDSTVFHEARSNGEQAPC